MSPAGGYARALLVWKDAPWIGSPMRFPDLCVKRAASSFAAHGLVGSVLQASRVTRPIPFVRPLEPAWQQVVDAALLAVARRQGRAPLRIAEVARLAPKLVELSRAYNEGEAEGSKTKLPLEARVAFSFIRDVPKGAAAVRELLGAGGLVPQSPRPLRILDLGAGLGAMTWGIVRALGEAGASCVVEATLVDEDADVLLAARDIARAAEEQHALPKGMQLRLETRTSSLDAFCMEVSERFDLIVLGQVLSELSPRDAAEVRCDAQAALVTKLMGQTLAPGGTLVIVEPALRARTRHLHALRDALLSRGAATVLAPCLHAAPCPMFRSETDWCHEDLPIDLPSWLAPLARAAGLRWQGLTFSYLVLGEPSRLGFSRPRLDASAVRFRAVSDILRSKGKMEIIACEENGALRRMRRLDRDAPSTRGLPFDALRRGDVVTLTAADERAEPAVDERGRIARSAYVAVDGAPLRG